MTGEVMYVFSVIVLCMFGQVQEVETDIPDVPAPVVQDEGEAYIEESLRQSIERARELASQPSVEWPEQHDNTSSFLSSETQSLEVLQRMRAGVSPAVRLRALEGWVEANTQDTPQVLIEALSDPDDQVAAYAAGELLKLAEQQNSVADNLNRYYIEQVLNGSDQILTSIDRVLPRLRPILEDPMLRTLQSPEEEAPRQAAAARCLGGMGSMKAIDALARNAWAGKPVLAQVCVEALLKLPHPRTSQIWLRLLNHPQLVIRMMAVEGVSMAGGPTAGDALVQIALSNAENESNLRVMAVAALDRWPIYQSIPLLIRVLDGRPGVRSMAYSMLQARTGVQLELVPQDWQAWWMEYGQYGDPGPQVSTDLQVRPRAFDLEYIQPGGAPIVPGAETPETDE